MPEITDPELLKELNAYRVVTTPDKGKGRAPKQFGNATEVLVGVSQGLIDPVEGLVQLAEKSSGWKLAPESVRNFARDWRNRAQSTYAGIGGEVIGNVLPAFATGGTTIPAALAGTLPKALIGLAPRAGAAAAQRLIPRAIVGAGSAAAAPVSGDSDYWRTKREQAALGAVTGGTVPALGHLAGQVAPLIAHAGLPRWLSHLAGGTIGAGATGVSRAVISPGPGGYGRVAGVVRG